MKVLLSFKTWGSAKIGKKRINSKTCKGLSFTSFSKALHNTNLI